MNNWGLELNVYATPAVLTLVLLLAETAFLVVFLPETRGKSVPASAEKQRTKTPTIHGNGNGKHQDGPPKPKRTVESRIAILRALRKLHFFFLVLFSGVEFTLTFLTFDCKLSRPPEQERSANFAPSISIVLDWSNTQNGKLIGSIGIISALLQGGYVRRSMTKVGEGNMARRGVSSCAVALILLSLLPKYVQTQPSLGMKLLQAAAVCMAFTSATVVNSLTAFASLQCDEGNVDENTGKVVQEHPHLAKGKALGEFRSSGQLGRALGPLLGERLNELSILFRVLTCY